MSELLVSIITVAFNSEKTIKRTIESVLNQTYTNIEYIIVDGASKDRTMDIVREYQPLFNQSDGKKLLYVSEPDNGMYDALNKGISMAHGELIGNINTDDWYEVNAVSRMVDLYQEENYDLAWSDIRIIKPSGNMIKRAHIGKLWTTSGFCHPTMFSKRSVLLEYPYACCQMDDDFDMVTRAYKAGKKICLLNEVLANYSFGGMSTEKSIKKSVSRIKMKYRTYRRNGLSRMYLFYCIAMETAKYVLG